MRFGRLLKYISQDSNITPKVVPAWTDTAAANSGIDQYSTSATLSSFIRFMINIGTQFDFRSIRVPLAGSVDANTTITPKIWLDDLSSSTTLTVINNTNNPGARKANFNGTDLKNTTARNNAILEFAWTGTKPVPIGFPITIDLDIKEDEP